MPSKKGQQSAKHSKSGKYKKQFARTVKRLRRWRGRIVDDLSTTKNYIK